MSTPLEIRNARAFKYAQQCFDDRLPAIFFDDSDDETRTQKLAGADVEVVFNWCHDETVVIGVLVDGELVDESNFARHVVREWTKNITKELTA